MAWSKTGRGSYMPTPLAYRGLLYVLANNGVLDAYELATGKEIYRQRLPLVGSGFSASPVAADGKIYLSNEDGEMLVVEAGETFKHIAHQLDGRDADGDASALRRRHVSCAACRRSSRSADWRAGLKSRRLRAITTEVLPSTCLKTGIAFSMSSMRPSEMRA